MPGPRHHSPAMNPSQSQSRRSQPTPRKIQGARGGGTHATGHQQPPWKSSLDVAWSYSRSQAHGPLQQDDPSAPSFTEHHWAGPSYTTGTDDEGEEDYDEDDVDELQDDDEDDADRTRTLTASGPEGEFDPNEMIEADAFSPVEAFTPRHRGLDRLTQQDRDASDGLRSRSRNRSPKRIAVSSNFHSLDATTSAAAAGSSTSAHRPTYEATRRPSSPLCHRSAFLGADGMVKAVKGSSASDFPLFRVGSHYERYSQQGSSRDHARVRGGPSSTEEEEHAEGERGRGRTRQVSRGRSAGALLNEETPLLSHHRSRPRLSRMYSGRSAKGSKSASPDVGRIRTPATSRGVSRMRSPIRSGIDGRDVGSKRTGSGTQGQQDDDGISLGRLFARIVQCISQAFPCIGARRR